MGELDYNKIKIKKTNKDQNQKKKSVKKTKMREQIENEQQISDLEHEGDAYNEDSNISKQSINSKAQKSRTCSR